MTYFLCKVCDRSLLEIPFVSLESLITPYQTVINIVKLDEVDKILNDYDSANNNKFYIYYIYCEFKIQFDNNFTTGFKTDYVHNKEIEKISQCLLYPIEYLASKGYNFHNINQMSIITFSCRCNMKNEHYMNQPMPSVERRINMVIAKNPQLINLFDRYKKHPLIRKYFHIPFND